jgi:hypothetical protein
MGEGGIEIRFQPRSGQAPSKTTTDGAAVIFQDIVPLHIPRKPVVAGAVRKWKSDVTISKARTYRAVFCTAQ